jgi:Spy/CpxP family protein refolding chaperone
MKAKVIVVSLLSIATASQPAFSAVGAKLPADGPPHVAPSVPADGGETVVVAMPFSSLQLNPSLVEYLGLSPTQVRSIQKLMDQEQPKTEPLMLELRTISAKLGIAVQRSQSNDNEGAAKELAATQDRLLKQLMTANLRLQRRIDDVLYSQQRKKLDALKRAAGVSVGEGN